ncbi:MAG: NAD(P)/FAD-dependent oxidoreductase, partial [Nevskiaceae bacterium]|nr:NAD(P)/FAD-dependent oxidoreductase [Nevskiaceae bacterium]
MIERDEMQYDVVVVGAGPAGLACAIRLKQLNPERSVCVLEKAAEVGGHALSGAVLEPQALDALLPGWRDDPPATCVPATRDTFAWLTRDGAHRLPVPPQQHNRGNVIVSLGQLTPKMARDAEDLGVDVLAGFAAAAPLFNADGSVAGVQVGDMGLDAHGNPTADFTAGPLIRASTTIVAEGCRGSLAKRLIAHYRLDADRSPQTFALGMKELWQLPAGRVEPGLIEHSLGWPLAPEEYGGSFVYHLNDDRVYVGYVVGLDYKDPRLSPFEAFQQFKHHPTV